MLLARRSPTRDLDTFQDMIDRFFQERRPWSSQLDASSFSTGGIPLDIFEEGENVMVKATVPGLNADELHVEVNDDLLHIWGEHKAEKERKDENYYLHERRYGRIERSARLPYPVRAERATAEFEDGVLSLTLPKDTEAQRREIKVQAKR